MEQENNLKTAEEEQEKREMTLNTVKKELSNIDNLGLHDRIEYFSTLNKTKQRKILDLGSKRFIAFNTWNEKEKDIILPRLGIMAGFTFIGVFPAFNAFFKRGRGSYGSPLKRFLIFGMSSACVYMLFSEACAFVGLREEIKRENVGDIGIDELNDL